MSLTNSTVLVTGAGGFIGSHLTERLVREGAGVRAFVRYNSRHDVGLLSFLDRRTLDAVDVVAGDLRDANAVREAMRGVDVVFHLGALIAIPYSYLHPREVVETNVMGTLNVLMAARDLGTRHVVHTSTSEVYGTARYVPIDEAHPLQGQSPYSASKIGADKIAESFYRSFGLPVTTLRPFNTYGPRQSARAVIPTIIVQALESDQIRLGALAPRRDFTFVLDTVDAFLRIAAAEDTLGREINAGSSASISIGELAARIMALVGRELPITCEDERLRPADSEVMHLHAAHDTATALMGWTPRTSLDEGLSITIDWIRRHIHLYRPEVYEV
ncbi:MAG: GDP-mannose 4,6-dehydratase [Anaerolineae bacterium]|nr:GDP-mannose 4,6-dehydratase [Anaerolineae bacterium]